MKFKKGDRVRVKTNPPKGSGIPWRGKTGTITGQTSTASKNPYVDFDEVIIGSHKWNVPPEDLELETEREFKVGDRVISTLSPYLGKDFRNQKGTITRLDKKRPNTAEVKVDNLKAPPGHEGYIFNTKYLRHLDKESSSPAAKKETESLPAGYKETPEGFITNQENWKPGKWLI